jgi:acylphosphatase
VQGVLYRVWCKREASKLELGGWVRNTDDGRVEAVFEGPKDKVQEMVKKCKRGSKYSKVEDIEIVYEETIEETEEFEIIS